MYPSTTSSDPLFILQPSNLDTEETASTSFLTLKNEYSQHNVRKSFYYRNKSCFRKKYVIIGSVVVIVVIIAIVLILLLHNNDSPKDDLVTPDPEMPMPPSPSKLRIFKNAAVCADSEKCAFIGNSMLKKNGSAVDAAVAALICNGLFNMQSMGLGGGFQMTIYQKSTGKAYVMNARDSAPGAAHRDMFKGLDEHASTVGGLSMNVPGELAGYWEAHLRFGKLNWSELVEPTIEVCDNGFNLSKATYNDLSINGTLIRSDPYLKDLYVDETTGEFRKPNSLIKPKILCDTLRIIARGGAPEFYNGTLGSMIIEDIRKRGSILTKEDFANYRAEWEEPFEAEILDGTKMYSVGAPGSGPLLALILHMFDNFGFGPKDLSDIESTIKTYHRITETFKYAYALRTGLADPMFVNITDVITQLSSKEFAKTLTKKINENMHKTNQVPAYYGMKKWDYSEDHGTSHISIIASNGDAVSATSTINSYFGSGVVSERTGILMNNGIDDFGIPGRPNYFDTEPSERNYIQPGKRPVSSMAPTIFVDHNKDVNMVVGAAGGTKITTAIAYVVARVLWMNETIKEAVDAARIHHQLLPMRLDYEYGVRKEVIQGLQALGHKTSRYRTRGSVVCGLVIKNQTIYANADYRKGGEVIGIE